MTKFQNGYCWRVGKSWYGRWYRSELDENGQTVRVQHSEKLCEYSDRYRTKTDVLPLLADKLRNENEGRASAESTLTLRKYAEDFFLPYAERELKPSTAQGYRDYFRMYLKNHAGVPLRSCRCVTVTSILAKIHNEHPKLNSRTLSHCKSILRAIFVHAKRAGVIDGENPAVDAGIPKSARKPGKTIAYSVQDVLVMLANLTGIARAAVALTFFCGLRPGEARAAQWADYDEDRHVLRISRSIWRTHLGTPKTEESAGVVPVAAKLAEILAELPRTSPFILAAPSGSPIDFHNLSARVIGPALQRCLICHEPKAKHVENSHAFKLDESIPRWRSWYPARRGLATVATQLDTPLAAKGLLRHADLATTEKHYIKDVPAEAKRAMDKINALFDNQTGERPN
jgi:integrase